ncbi:MAG: NUDIX hydrolase [Thermaerobacter sp.]|nr:NUDIX hydrolase [Thermaerobacter sp.]
MTWIGAAACCLNARAELLMVLQGKPDEERLWSIPAGGCEKGETLEACCVREVREETGYEVEIRRKLFEKRGEFDGQGVEVHYFDVVAVGGEARIQDPDGLIHDVAWRSAEDISHLNLSFPEDRAHLLQFIADGMMG